MGRKPKPTYHEVTVQVEILRRETGAYVLHLDRKPFAVITCEGTEMKAFEANQGKALSDLQVALIRECANRIRRFRPDQVYFEDQLIVTAQVEDPRVPPVLLWRRGID